MEYKQIFKMPKPVSVIAKTSSITNSFVNGIIPTLFPSEEEIKKCLDILGLNVNDLRCSYCGDSSTEWDHLRPLVKNKKPTGYVSDIYNLVPACGKCNQSKGNKNWKEWIVSDAKLSPKSRGCKDIPEKIKRLETYESWKEVKPIDLAGLVDSELWEEHWKNYEKLFELMSKSQITSSEIKKQIKQKYLETQGSISKIT